MMASWYIVITGRVIHDGLSFHLDVMLSTLSILIPINVHTNIKHEKCARIIVHTYWKTIPHNSGYPQTK